MELADVLDSKSSGSDTVPVRPRSPAPYKNADIDTVSVNIGVLALYRKSLPSLSLFTASFKYTNALFCACTYNRSGKQGDDFLLFIKPPHIA